VNTWGPSLQGDIFWSSWNQKTARSLYSTIISAMPPDQPGSISKKTVLDITAYLFQVNGLPAGDKEIAGPNELNGVRVVRPK
jgi:hypothetical protein